MERFTVTEEHLALLKHYDPRRGDYGNTDWMRDVARILGWDLFEDQHGDKHLSKPQAVKAAQLHIQEIRVALECCLRVGAFEAGDYVREDFGDWRKAQAG